MNAPLQNQLLAQAARVDDDNAIDFVEYWDILVDNRWLIGAIAAVALALGGTYALLARPVYEANTLIQVEDNVGNAKDLLGEAAGLFDVKTATSAELEILRSRLVVGQAVDSVQMYIQARPHYLPLIGSFLASRSKSLSEPGFLGLGGYVTGAESLTVASFNVPRDLEGTQFRLTAEGGGQYVLRHHELDQEWRGSVGKALVATTPSGPLELLVNSMEAKPGADFSLVRHSRLAAIEDLQARLHLTEKGRQSGVIEATLRGSDPDQLTDILNGIGSYYVRQNTERKAAEAGKTLAFLDTQLPQFKKQLTQAEEQYNSFRNRQGTVALDEEAKLVLAQSVDLQAKLIEAQQKRRELVSRFTPQHPSIKTLDEQIVAWTSEIGRLNARIHRMPTLQQDALRLERDVKINNELYQQLQNSALQLQLVREGKIGNVRVIDEAARPERPVGPNRAAIFGVAGILGLLGGVTIALARNAFFRGVRNAQEIEAQTGLNVYSTIPLSSTQEALSRKASEKKRGLHVLAAHVPEDPAVESLRSLRTALQFAMLDAPNNRVLITGPTPGVGKSFVSANFAAVLASSGKRVLLVDADLRRGPLSQYFGVARTGGLSELLLGSISVQEAVRRNLLPNLDLVTTGTMPPNPAELMTSSALVTLLQQFSAQYDLVIIDTPPVLVAADTPSIAAQAGTLLLVARAGETQMGEVHESAKRLSQAGKGVTGVLLNALDLSRRHNGSYAYKYGGYRYRQYSYTARS